jgi:predicted DNA-binding WGR domain protein
VVILGGAEQRNAQLVAHDDDMVVIGRDHQPRGQCGLVSADRGLVGAANAAPGAISAAVTINGTPLTSPSSPQLVYRLPMLRYEFSDGTSNKFWAITLAGKSFTTTYGKIGSAGQQTVKQLATAADATREHDKLVAEKLRKGYKLVAGAARKAVVAIPKPRVANKADRKRLDALIAIGRMLAPNAKRLAADVTHAFADPVAYVVANAKRMNDRAIDEPIPTLPWVVLVNALDDANALVEIDWKTPAQDLEWNLRKLVKKFALPPADHPDDDERSTWEMLQLAGQALRGAKRQLVQLNMGSDSYALVVVPMTKLAALVRLAKQASYGVAEPLGDQLAAAQRDRLARMAKLAKQRAAPDRKPTPRFAHYARGKEVWWIKLPPAKLAFDTGFAAPRVKYYVNHYFKDAKRVGPAVKAQIAAWVADGFRAMSDAEAARLPDSGEAYLGWVGPFPAGARYFVGPNRSVACAQQRAETLWCAGGIVGRDFAELQRITHYKDETQAAQALATEVAEHGSDGWKPVERAELVARYKRKR